MVVIDLEFGSEVAADEESLQFSRNSRCVTRLSQSMKSITLFAYYPKSKTGKLDTISMSSSRKNESPRIEWIIDALPLRCCCWRLLFHTIRRESVRTSRVLVALWSILISCSHSPVVSAIINHIYMLFILHRTTHARTHTHTSTYESFHIKETTIR